MSESAFRTKVCRYLRANGVLIIPFVAHQYSMPGVPDTFMAHPSWHGFIEFKGVGTKLEPLQKKIAQRLKMRGVNYCILREGFILEDEEGITLHKGFSVQDIIPILRDYASLENMGGGV